MKIESFKFVFLHCINILKRNNFRNIFNILNYSYCYSLIVNISLTSILITNNSCTSFRNEI